MDALRTQLLDEMEKQCEAFLNFEDFKTYAFEISDNSKNLSYDSFLKLYDIYLMAQRNNILDSINFNAEVNGFNGFNVLCKINVLESLNLLVQEHKHRKKMFDYTKKHRELLQKIEKTQKETKELNDILVELERE